MITNDRANAKYCGQSASRAGSRSASSVSGSRMSSTSSVSAIAKTASLKNCIRSVPSPRRNSRVYRSRRSLMAQTLRRRYAHHVRAPRILRALLVIVGGLALSGIGAAPAFATDDPDSTDTPAVVALDQAGAGVDDFTFESFDAVYELSRGDDGRSQVRTTETLVAVFPDYDQNRGIKRALVTD